MPVKKFLFFLIWISFLCFWFDLFHMMFHLSKSPALWQIDGVSFKFLIKTGCFLLPLSLLVFRKKWMTAVSLSVLFLILFPSESRAFWGNSKTACQSAREMLENSGTAQNAKENLFGAVKLTPPEEKFPQGQEQVTWWGKFQPFEFWKSPEFKASWMNPQGEEAARQTFKGSHCVLAKTTLHAENLPRGEFQPGIWKVIVTCEDYVIDQRYFEVAGPRVNAPLPAGAMDQSQPPQVPITVWAKEKV